MSQTEQKVGRWVYAIETDANLPNYSVETSPSADAAIRAAMQLLGIAGTSKGRFRIMVGRLVHPAPPQVNARQILVQVYKDRYANLDAVLYRPSAENQTEEERRLWRDGMNFESLEKQLSDVISKWLSDEPEMSWLEVTDEFEATEEDIRRAISTPVRAYA